MITLSAKLARVVEEGGFDCPSGDLQLNDADVSNLSQILSREEETAIPIDRKRAVNAFVQVTKLKARADSSLEVLARILVDTTESQSTRIAAAAGLGQFSEQVSETTLILVLPSVSQTIQREVIKSLGKIGTRSALQALGALDVDDAVLPLVSQSELLIAHRTGGVFPEKIRDLFEVEWESQDARQLPKEEIALSIASLGGQSYGLVLSDELGVELNCGSTVNHLLFTDSKQGSLTQHARISGLVISKNPRELISTIRYLVHTQPSDSVIDIIVTRTSGEVVYSGEAQTDSESLRFLVRDIGATGAPTEISGQISNEGIEINVRSMANRRSKAGQRLN